MLYAFITSSKHVIGPAGLMLRDLIILIIFGNKSYTTLSFTFSCAQLSWCINCYILPKLPFSRNYDREEQKNLISRLIVYRVQSREIEIRQETSLRNVQAMKSDD
jgi:hypothetical protein